MKAETHTFPKLEDAKQNGARKEIWLPIDEKYEGFAVFLAFALLGGHIWGSFQLSCTCGLVLCLECDSLVARMGSPGLLV